MGNQNNIGVGDIMGFIAIGVVVFMFGSSIPTETITVKKEIIPEIKLIVKDNIIDTLYVYRKP